MKLFPFIQQHDAMQCGVACIAMICKSYGKPLPMSEIDRLCMSNRQGVSMKAMADVCQGLGFQTSAGKTTMDALADMTMPCILHWNQNHFVVLYRIKRGNIFYIADPGKGLVTYSREEFKRHWISAAPDIDNEEARGIVMLLEPTDAFFAHKAAESLDIKRGHSFQFLLKYVKNYRKQFLQIMLGLVFGSVAQLILPFLTQSIVDKGIHNKDIGFIWLVLLGQLTLTVSRTAVDFIRRWQMLHITMHVNISLVNDFFKKLLKLPMSFFETKLMGDLMQRMNDHNRVNAFLTQQTISITFAALSLVVFSIVLLSYNLEVFAIFMAGSIIYGVWMSLFLKRRKVLDYEMFEQQSINSNKTYEFLTTMQEIKLQDCERRRRTEWRETQTDMLDVQMKALKLQQTQEAGCVFINETKNIIITVASAAAVINGQMTLGMMLAVQYIIGQLSSPVEQLMSFIYSLQDVKISLERINEIHNMDEEDANNESGKGVRDMDNGINISNVMFKYDPHSQKKIIDKVSINIPHGKVTAIVGASGSGKTTLVKLMLGYYHVLDGKISIGGTDIDSLNKKWWRRQCGVVMQDGAIFSESIARNIAVDDGDIDKKRLLSAAEIACIKEYVMSLPLKFDTKIGRDGIGLSQGQKQRILIARAVYKNPDFIFLDEATNSLDANNERHIVENLDRFYKGKTVVIVAHRLSTVKNADQIVVIDKGQVVETGTHDSLTAKRGAYYELVRNQLELGN